MNYSDEINAIVAVHFHITPSSRKYNSPANQKLIAERISTYGLVPSDTGVVRSIQELVCEERLQRADGGNSETDAAAVRTAEQTRIDHLVSAPLTAADFTEFSQMGRSELERAFYSDAVFAGRYRKGAALWGFRLPAKPALAQSEIPVENDPSEWRNLDARTYHSLPTSKIIHLYRNDAGFKRAIDRLISNGKI